MQGIKVLSSLLIAIALSAAKDKYNLASQTRLEGKKIKYIHFYNQAGKSRTGVPIQTNISGLYLSLSNSDSIKIHEDVPASILRYDTPVPLEFDLRDVDFIKTEVFFGDKTTITDGAELLMQVFYEA